MHRKMNRVDSQNQGRRSELHLAAYSQDVDKVMACIAKGFNVNLKDNGGWTPIIWAIDMACTSEVGVAEEIISLLYKNGAEIDLEPYSGTSLVEFANEIHDDIGKYIKQLIKKE